MAGPPDNHSLPYNRTPPLGILYRTLHAEPFPIFTDLHSNDIPWHDTTYFDKFSLQNQVQDFLKFPNAFYRHGLHYLQISNLCGTDERLVESQKRGHLEIYRHLPR